MCCRFSFASIEQQYVAESLQTMSRHHGGGAGKRKKCCQPSTCKKRYLGICSCSWHDQGKLLVKENTEQSLAESMDSKRIEMVGMCKYRYSARPAEQKDDIQNLVLQSSHRQEIW